MTSLYKVGIEAYAVDKASQTLGKVKTSIEQTGKASKSATTPLSGLGSAISGISKTALGALGIATSFGGAIMGLGALAKSSVSDWVNYNEEIRKMGVATGASTEDLSRLMQAADDVGVSMGAMQTSFRIMARQGVQPSIEAVAQLSDRLRAIEDPTERAKEAAKLLGRGWTEAASFILKGGDYIRKATGAIEDNLVVTKQSATQARQYAKAVDDLQDAWTGFKNEFAMRIIPTLTGALKKLSDAVTTTTEEQVEAQLNATKSTLVMAEAYGVHGKALESTTKLIENLEERQLRLTATQELQTIQSERAALAMQHQKNSAELLGDQLDETTLDTDEATQAAKRLDLAFSNLSDELKNKTAPEMKSTIEDVMMDWVKQAGFAEEQILAIGTAFGGIDEQALIAKLAFDKVMKEWQEGEGAQGVQWFLDRLYEIRNTWLNLLPGSPQWMNTWRKVTGGGKGKTGETGETETGGMPGGQAGMPVSSYKPYLVGEMGPEMFVPYTAGRIVPNQTVNNWNLTINEAGRRNNVRADFAYMRAMAGAR